MYLARGCFFFAALTAVTACQRPDLMSPSARGGRLITQGVVIKKSDYPTVVDIGRISNSQRCTGTFIRQNPPTLLTASHCLSELPSKDDTTGGVVVGETDSVRACVPKGALGLFGPRDLAVVVFPSRELEVRKVSSITSHPIAAKLPVTLIGFGHTDAREPTPLDVDTEKRLGRNTIFEIMEKTDRRGGMIHLRGAVSGELKTLAEVNEKAYSSAAPGDSGGPLFATFADSGEQLIGVMSGGRVEKGVAFSYYVNLTDEPVKKFLQQALKTDFLKAMSEEKEPPNYRERCALSLAGN